MTLRNAAAIVLVCASVPIAAAAQVSDSIRAEVLLRSTTSWDGSELPAYPEGEPEITVLRITIPPKSRLPLHEHPVINAGYLVSGELTVETTDGQIHHLDAGKAIVELVEQPHFGRNDGDVPAQIIVFYAGTKDRPITIRR